MTRSFFTDIQQMVDQMSDGDIERMKAMVKDLNDMLVKKIAGEDPGFDEFMAKYTQEASDEATEYSQKNYPAMRELTGQYLMREITIK